MSNASDDVLEVMTVGPQTSCGWGGERKKKEKKNGGMKMGQPAGELRVWDVRPTYLRDRYGGEVYRR
jgi:hypothetical protein